jgi:ABC-type uncharacterized transport system ATPase subunit
MAEAPENLVLEHLRAIRGDIAKLSNRVDHLATGQSIMQDQLAVLVRQGVHHETRFADIEARLDRIEKRLELAGTDI